MYVYITEDILSKLINVFHYQNQQTIVYKISCKYEVDHKYRTPEIRRKLIMVKKNYDRSHTCH